MKYLYRIKIFFVQREYWPAWLFRIPLVFMRIWNAIKAGHPFFFSAVNPDIPGWFMKEPKSFTYSFLPKEVIPRWCIVNVPWEFSNILSKITATNLSFPCVIKPNWDSVRWDNVFVLHNHIECENILWLLPKGEYLVQEFVPWEEYSIYYYRFPWNKTWQILGITKKVYPSIIGDGKHTIKELITMHDRYKRYCDLFQHTYKVPMHKVPSQHETIALAQIGNHCKGSMFLDWSAHSTKTLVHYMDSLFWDAQIFMYRLDIKTPSQQDLLAWRFIILEVNAGVFAEPTFVYDPSYALLDAYRAFSKVWKIARKISVYNHKVCKTPYISLSDWWKNIRLFLSK